MSSIVLIAALAAQVLPPPGQVRWEPLLTGGAMSLDIDPATISREGELSMYTVRMNVGAEASGGPSVMIMRNAMNCRTGQIGIMAGDGYDSNGRLIGSRTTPPAEVVYQTYPEDEDARRVRSRVCAAND